MSSDPDNYLAVGATLFALGALGFLTRRNLILMVLSAELMLHGVSLNFVAFGFAHQNHDGQAFAVFIITVAACEAALALVLILALYQRRKNLDVSVWRTLRDPRPAAPPDDRALTPEPSPASGAKRGRGPRTGRRTADEEIETSQPEVTAHV